MVVTRIKLWSGLFILYSLDNEHPSLLSGEQVEYCVPIIYYFLVQPNYLKLKLDTLHRRIERNVTQLLVCINDKPVTINIGT